MQPLYTVIDDIYDHTVGAVLSAIGFAEVAEISKPSVITLPPKTESPVPLHDDREQTI